MRFSERVAQGSLAPLRSRYREEVERLVAAGHRVMRRRGFAGATVAEILAEAALSTRAFYRHFGSKDGLLLAMYEHDAEQVNARIDAALAAAPTPRERLEAWIDQMLALAFDERRVRRTRLLQAEAGRLAGEKPELLSRIVEEQVSQLGRVLAEGKADGTFAGAKPAEDARSIHALVWNLSDASYGAAAAADAKRAREHVLRFVLPALGAAAAPSKRGARRAASARPRGRR